MPIDPDQFDPDDIEDLIAWNQALGPEDDATELEEAMRRYLARMKAAGMYKERKPLPPDLEELRFEMNLGIGRHAMDPTEPRHRLGRYEVFGWKRGGMGVILEGWDPRLKRKVAVKLWIDEEANAKIIKEAETLARFTEDHNIVTVFDVGVWNGRHYFVMEWIDGCDVEEWLE